MSERQKRLRTSEGFNCDRVLMNVGGKIFVTSKTTLASNSTYFQSMFSSSWRAYGTSNDGEIFVDYDPAVFEVLLKYMRQGCIPSKSLDEDVILGAEFFGCERLLLAIKCLVYRHQYPRTLDYDSAEVTDEYLDGLFHHQYGSVRVALARGVLPDVIKAPSKENSPVHSKEEPLDNNSSCRIFFDYASLECKVLLPSPEKYTVRAIIADETGERRTDVMEEFSIIQGLTFLHAQGFTQQVETTKWKSPRSDKIMFRLRLCRPSECERTRACTTAADIILCPNLSSKSSFIDRKEFALLTVVEANFGVAYVSVAYIRVPYNSKKTSETDFEKERKYLRSLDTFRVAIVKKSFSGFDLALRWLCVHGFVTEEKSYQQYFLDVEHALVPPYCDRYSVFSRIMLTGKYEEFRDRRLDEAVES